jgi:hypothetical protein
MVEPHRLEPFSTPDGDADRDAQADALLVQGLDHYFAGRYEDAIHIWTRVLFLDRSHPRARAYIDRARTALNERQRASDELLHTSERLLNQGETGAARLLLARAVASTGEDEQASALRIKLERRERAERAPAGRAPDPLTIRASEIVPGWSWPRRRRTVVVATIVAVGLTLAGLASSTRARVWMGWESANEILAASTAPDRLPVLSSAEVALVRAKTLYGRGRLAEALQALDRVGSTGALGHEADALRVQIQQLLLAGGQSGARANQGSGR